MKRILTLVFVFYSLFADASHIVGGEFQLTHKQGQEYELSLLLYFDVINGNPGARDSTILARIFRKFDNSQMFDVQIPLISTERVEYFLPECSNGEVVTDRLLYSTTITLTAEDFNDQDGYYIAWERCCRNYGISNIFSDDPNTGGIHAGQTFYLEFPAVIDQNGDPFINSSPKHQFRNYDYACPNREYWIDFAGVDEDGDSLVYSLVTPLNTFTPVAIPAGGPRAGPYPKVSWRDGFSIDNIMGGNPDLKIDGRGFLSVTPMEEGLFVFAIKYEEYRNNVKIGEVITDFQLFVIDACPAEESSIPPVIKGRWHSNEVFQDGNVEIVVTEENSESRFFQVEVTDLEALFKDEGISLKVFPINFIDSEVDLILPEESTAILDIANQSVVFDLELPACPLDENDNVKTYELAVVVFDDLCTRPMFDTLIVKIQHPNYPENNTPYFAHSVEGEIVEKITHEAVLSENGFVEIPILAFDEDNQKMKIELNPVNSFDLSKAGMSFSEVESTEGELTTFFRWDYDVNNSLLDFSEGVDVIDNDSFTRKKYEIEVVIEDIEQCGFSNSNTLKIELFLDINHVTGVTNFSAKNAVEVYPNPTNQYFYVKIDESSSDRIEFHLTDISGKRSYNIKNNALSDRTYQIDIIDFLPSGIYVLKTSIENHEYVNKIIIE